MIQSAPYYWLTCDEDGCGTKSTEGDEFSAWSDQDQALDMARCSEWWIGDDGYQFCERHVPTCDTCGVHLDEDKTCPDYDENTHPSVG